MSDFRVATRYAKSLFDLAIELKKVEKLNADMQLVNQVCAENHKLITLLNNPVIKSDVKLKVLIKIFGKHVDPITVNFFKLVCRKNRAEILPEISRIFMTLFDDSQGIVRANVISAVALSSENKKDFENILTKETGKKVSLENQINESILGGYILKIGDKQIDNSLKTKMNNLRRELKSRP